MTAGVRRVKHRLETMRKSLRGKLLLQELMSRHTTMGVGGPADAFFLPADREDLRQAIRLCREMEVPWLAVGNGSNLLVREGGIRGLVICTLSLTDVRLAGEGGPDVEADSGLPMSRLLNFCVTSGLTGLEFTTGIPGTVGGAVLMNAGAYGSQLSDVLAWVDLIDARGDERRLPRKDIKLGYRYCRLPAEGVVAAAGFHLLRAPEAVILERIKGLLKQRGRKLPFGWMSAGSVFKNPGDRFAGQLIEELGLKGRRIGDAQVSEQHANVIINLGSATARDVLGLMEEIVRVCRERTGIALEQEIVVVGEP